MSKPQIWVLDHGFVELLNIAGPVRRPDEKYDGSDVDPAKAARMSFDENTMDNERPEAADLKLCEYLMKNRHNTPFEMVEIWLEMKLPIFVARQFVRHRTVSINEISGRYAKLQPEWYIPNQVRAGSAEKKQGSVGVVGLDHQAWFQSALHMACQSSYEKYEEAIERGVANELARLFLHVNHYTHWLWKQDLHNIMHYLSLRDHSHAQWEAQQYAMAVKGLLKAQLPNTMELYEKHRKQQEG